MLGLGRQRCRDVGLAAAEEVGVDEVAEDDGAAEGDAGLGPEKRKKERKRERESMFVWIWERRGGY